LSSIQEAEEEVKIKKSLIIVFAGVVMILSLGSKVVLGNQQIPPQPNYVPAEISVSPSAQTVFSPQYRAVWNVYIQGEGSSYCIQVNWGDFCGSYKTCGYAPGGPYQFYHDFLCGGSSPFRQTWTLSGVGGPSYATTTVYK
jgi:hypothetical protein